MPAKTQTRKQEKKTRLARLQEANGLGGRGWREGAAGEGASEKEKPSSDTTDQPMDQTITTHQQIK